MATEVIMPQMGESIAEGTITRWLVAVGDRIERDQPLLEISTDKVDAEVPSPASGVLLEVLYDEGETVEVDTVIGRIGAAEEATAAGAAEPPAVAAASEGTPTGAGDKELGVAETQPLPVAAEAASAAPGEAGEAESFEQRVRRFSSPVVRKIAAAESVDLERVEGTGIHGRVTKKDILGYLERREAGTEAPSAAPAARPATAGRPARPPQPVPAGQTGGGPWAPPGFEFSVPAYTEQEQVTIEPMSRIRRLTAAHMLYSQQVSAHVATVFDVDLSSVVSARNRAKDAFLRRVGTKLTFMPFFFKAVVSGLQSFPKFNASLDGTDIVYKKAINLGMAVALDWGLIVPVIHDADQLNLVGLAQRANDLADRARQKKLKPEEVQGGTFTITNPGVLGSLYGTPLINQPQVAILCLGAIEKRPVVITDEHGNDALAIRPMAYLALSYDHRLIDGADAERFMVKVKETLTTDRWSELDPYRE